jgi:hypothetical protein
MLALLDDYSYKIKLFALFQGACYAVLESTWQKNRFGHAFFESNITILESKIAILEDALTN